MLLSNVTLFILAGPQPAGIFGGATKWLQLVYLASIVFDAFKLFSKMPGCEMPGFPHWCGPAFLHFFCSLTKLSSVITILFHFKIKYVLVQFPIKVRYGAILLFNVFMVRWKCNNSKLSSLLGHVLFVSEFVWNCCKWFATVFFLPTPAIDCPGKVCHPH